MKILKFAATSIICCSFLFGVAFATVSVEPITLPSSSVFTWIKIKEWTKINLFTFKKTSKAGIYNGYSDRRISEMEYALEKDDEISIDRSLERFETQKQKALEYAKNANDKAVMQRIRERTLEQQRTMTKLQLQLSNNSELQQNVVRVQKQIANQTNESVEVVEGTEAAVKVETQTWVVWRDPSADIDGNLPKIEDTAELEYAPGTTAGGTGGRVYEGGGEKIWAPGTSAGGTSSETKSTNVIEGDSGSSGNTQSGNGEASGNSQSNTVVEVNN